jgi:hypothetical protein
MEALTAVGLASNIVQFISFAGDLVSTSKQISRSANGTLVENLEIEAIAQNLQNLSESLRVPPIRRKDEFVENPKYSKEVKKPCEGCHQVKKLKPICEECRDAKALRLYCNGCQKSKALRQLCQGCKESEALKQLCEGCRHVGGLLIEKIQGLRVDKKLSGKVGRQWASFRQALKTVLAAEDIEDLEERLNRYQKTINTTLLASLR